MHQRSAGVLALAAILAMPAAVTASEPAGTTPTEDVRLVDAARAEGGLTVVALPRDWCNYGAIIDAFEATYGIEVRETNPFGSSADAIQAIRDSIHAPGPDAPDVIDVGPTFALDARAEGLLRPYRVRTWRSIPDAARDVAGAWYGGYYGLLAFEADPSLVDPMPADWRDLLAPAHAQQVALGGDPRVSAQGLHAVYASALVNGGSLDDAAPGLDFWRELHERGNLVPVVATPERIDAGVTPLAIRWTYNALAHQRAHGDVAVVVPPSARVAGMYVQAISAYAPHPLSARLWMEFLFSDAGQRAYARGSCTPTRLDDLVARDAITEEELALLPDSHGTLFPTVDQLRAAASVIQDGWGPVVGVDIE